MSAEAAERDAPRRLRAADAAIEVIAAEGLRGLTHRACDVHAGLPPGSTSSCFRTRLALLGAVLDRMVALDRDTLEQFPVDGWGVATAEQREQVVELFTQLLGYWLGPARSRTLARMELYLDAVRHTGLQAELVAANRRYLDRAAAGMRAAGIADPDEAARVLVAQLDGVLYDALARPFLGGAEPDGLRSAVRHIVRGFVTDRSAP